MKVIIFKREDDGISVIYPAPDALDVYGIVAIARKDVPAGRPFKIIDSKDLPPRESRGAWIVDDSDLTDGVGADGNTFEEVLP